MKKLLLAVNSPVIAEELIRNLSGVFQISVCYNGNEALELISLTKPDILVLDLMLPGTDGLSIIKAIRDVGVSAKVVALSAFVVDYTLAALESLHVQHAIRLSVDCTRNIISAVLDLERCEEPVDLRQAVRNKLLSLGVSMSSSGYYYLETAILLHIADPTQHIVSQIYPAVAKLCNGTPTQVEKAIRTLIGEAFRHCNKSLWQMYFPTMQLKAENKPTNLAFIRTISNCILKQTASPEETDMRSCAAL